MPSQSKFPKERIERAARIYHTAGDAGRALGIASNSFLRLCKRYGIDRDALEIAHFRLTSYGIDVSGHGEHRDNPVPTQIRLALAAIDDTHVLDPLNE